MEVSSPFQGKPRFSSQTALYLASIHDKLCVLRDAVSLKVIQTYKLSSPIDHVAMSPDSDLILCYAVRNEEAEIKLFGTASSEVLGTITPGIEGFQHAAFLDSRNVAVWSDVKLRITIWRFANNAIKPLVHIPYPKLAPKYGWRLTKDGRYFVVCQRSNGKDVIGIYDGRNSWSLTQQFDSATTDAADLFLSACERYIAIIESPYESSLYVYTLNGQLLLKQTFEDSTGLGIRCVTWHEDYLAVGDYASQIYLISSRTWSITSTHSLLPTLSTNPFPVHRPPSTDWLTLTRGYAIVPFTLNPSAPLSTLLSRPSTKPAPGSKTGICQLLSSPKHLAVRVDTYPNTIFIYTLKRLKTVLEYDEAVTGMQWRPLQEGENCEALVVAYGVKGIGLWFDDGSKAGRAEGMGIPSKSELEIKRVEWSEDGSKLLLKGKTTFCVAYPIAAAS